MKRSKDAPPPPKKMDITSRVSHPAVYKPRPYGNDMSYKKFCEEYCLCLPSVDYHSKIETWYTDDRHRKMWGVMIKLALDVRHCNLTLSEDTFKDENMVVVDGCHLRFLKLEGFVSDGSTGDLIAIANKIDSVVARQGRMLTDVDFLIHDLKTCDPTNSVTRAFLMSNYATMDSTTRKLFLMSLSNKLHSRNPKFEKAMRTICRIYEEENDWRARVTKDKDSPIYKAFKHREYPEHDIFCLVKFIRNGLHHLAEHGKYVYEDTWYIMNGYFGQFMSSVQHNLFRLKGLNRYEYVNYQRPTC